MSINSLALCIQNHLQSRPVTSDWTRISITCYVVHSELSIGIYVKAIGHNIEIIIHQNSFNPEADILEILILAAVEENSPKHH